MKTIFSKLWMVIALLLTSFPALAYDFEVDGICYDKNSDPYLTGEGAVYVTANPNKQYSGDIVIPHTVQKGGYSYKIIGISNNTFKDCVDLNSVRFISEENIYMGSKLFQGCTNLSKVQLPMNLTGIPDGAFKNCSSLNFIELPSTIRIIETEAFANCTKLRTLLVPNSIQILGLKAFDNCSSLENVFFTSLKKPYCEGDSEKQVFSNCNSKLSLWVPDKSIYNFGKEYVSFGNSEFQYSGEKPEIEVNNNLTSYQYSITWANTEKDFGQYETFAEIEYKGEIQFNVNIPYSYSITKAPLVVSVNDATRRYGQENPVFTLEYSGFLNSENESVLWQHPTITTEATKESDVGAYTIIVSGGAAKNYELVAYYSGILSISPASLILKAQDAQRVYYENNPEFSFVLDGLCNGDNANCILTQPTYSCIASNSSDCGEYEIIPSNAQAKNYEISYQKGKLTVTKAPLTLIASDVSREYGDPNPILSYKAIGLKGDDTALTAISEDPILSTTATESSVVGQYPIVISDGSAKNYTLSYKSGILTITKAPLTVIAENAERMYGENNPTFTRAYLGFKLNDTEATAFSSLPKLSCSASKTSDVGSYPITVNAGISRNYEIVDYEDGVLNIIKASLTLTANNKSRLYFEDNPTFDFTLSGLKNDDTKSCLIVQPSFTCEASKTSNVGDYAIEASGASATNYDIEYRPGTLSVNSRQLAASVGNYTKKYGEENPIFNVAYTGFVNNEDKSVLISEAKSVCSADKLSDVGEYTISVEGGSASNYLISQYNSGKLTITKANQTLTWNQDLSDIQQFSQIALEAMSSAGLPVTYEMSPNNVATLYNNSGTWYLDCFGTGAVNIRAIQTGDKNHNAATMLSKTLIVSGTGDDPSNPQIYLNVEEAGTLPSLIADNRKYQIKNLRLTGYLNGTDINFLREMAGSDSYGNKTEGILETLDISGCTIVSGGRSYYKSCYTENYKVGDYMFYNCNVLENLMLPGNTSIIGDFAFADCDRLSVISIPNEVKSFGAQSFRNDISLLRIPMPQSLTSIGDMAFMGCNGISEITLPVNVKTIGDGIVKNCQNISQINVESGNSYFISQDGVLYTNSLEELLIFPANYNSTKYSVSDGTQKIAANAFVNAKKLTDVTLPSSLQSVGHDAFIGCVNLATLQVNALTPPNCDNDCFETVSKTRCELRVPKGCYNYYWVAPVWSEFNKIVEVDISNIVGVSVDNTQISVEGCNIIIAGVPTDTYVRIYQMNGLLLYQRQSNGENILYQPAANGTYIVVIGNKTFKLFIK